MAKKTSSKSKADAEDIVDAEVVMDEQDADLATEAEVSEVGDQDVGQDASDDITEIQADQHTPEATQNPTLEPNDSGKSGGGFIPLLLGGLVAGGIGFGAATYFERQANDETTLVISSLEQQIATLSDRLEALPAPVDLSPIESSLSATSDQISRFEATANEALSELSERMSVVEKQPSGDGTLQEAAIAAYERDIQALRDQLDAQQAAVDTMMNDAAEQLRATQEEALAIEEKTLAAARAATARSAIARIQTALDTGGSFSAILAELEQSVSDPIPEGLSSAADGVATVAALSESFPPAAREALAIARAEGLSGEDETGLSAFLKSQFSVRSVEPMEGSSADAILSRAEAAVGSGRISEALVEIAALPEVSRAALSGWVAEAEARAAAVDAANSLFSKYNVN